MFSLYEMLYSGLVCVAKKVASLTKKHAKVKIVGIAGMSD
jgi:hypothetical protein